MITQSHLKSILHYNPVTGNFSWKKNNKIAGWVHHTLHTDYIRINIGKKKYRAHRLAFLYMTGKFPIGDVDHIDADGLNNKWCNLRSVSRSTNRRNSAISNNNTSGITGVSWNKKLSAWEVRLCSKRVGITNNLFEAACIRFSAQNNAKYFTDRHGR